MFKTSEYVSLGHPDKIADYISEKLLDHYLVNDPNVRYAVEVQVKNNVVNLAGEVSSTYNPDYTTICNVVRESLNDIGYTQEYADKWDNVCINPLKLEVYEYIHQQSPDISVGVDREGWGDQGIFFGYAVNNFRTNYMPEDYYMAQYLGKHLYTSVKNGVLENAGLDIKTQITLENSYGTNYLKQVIVAIPLLDDNKLPVIEQVNECLSLFKDRGLFNSNTSDYTLIINGTGTYKIHSSVGDCGTTGRKLAVDFYGGNCRIGGGSPWTKDGTKADLTLNLFARHLALTSVFEYSTCRDIEVQISCCIGQKGILVNRLKDGVLLDSYTSEVPTSELITMFRLKEPIFTELCREGLFSKIKG